MVRKTKEEAENTRREIMGAALDVFYQKGYSRTTFEDIATRIGLTKGAVYWHFKNKPDLLMELIRQYWDRRFNTHLEVNSLDELRDAMVKEAKRIHADADERKFLFFVMFQMEWSEAMVNKLHETILGVRDFPLQRMKNTLTNMQNNGQLKSGVKVEELAMVLFYVWKGALADGVINGDSCDFSKIVARGVDLIISGVKK